MAACSDYSLSGDFIANVSRHRVFTFFGTNCKPLSGHINISDISAPFAIPAFGRTKPLIAELIEYIFIPESNCQYFDGRSSYILKGT